jgi:hypothetical protein
MASRQVGITEVDEGNWKWMLRNHPSPKIARLMGWSRPLVGLSCIPAAVVLALWDRNTATSFASLVALFLIGAGTYAWGRGVSLSRAR